MTIQRFLLVFLIAISLGGCVESKASTETKVGLLLEDTIDDQGWNRKAYQGLLNIHSNLNIDVSFREDVNTKSKVEAAVKEYIEEGTNLIFGHGRFYADLFTELGPKYPDVHFVCFNGDVSGENVTSLQFNGYAMGYFAGMVASSMSESNYVGVIAAFPWQPEVTGFLDGAALDDETVVEINFVEDWIDGDVASEQFNRLKEKGVDVFYPAGDGFHVQIIEKAKKEGLFAIGFVSDQSDLGESTVITSTVQHVDVLYEKIVEQFNKNNLEAGNLSFDFDDGVITLGEFSSMVPEDIQMKVEQAIDVYIETGVLPDTRL